MLTFNSLPVLRQGNASPARQSRARLTFRRAPCASCSGGGVIPDRALAALAGTPNLASASRKAQMGGKREDVLRGQPQACGC